MGRLVKEQPLCISARDLLLRGLDESRAFLQQIQTGTSQISSFKLSFRISQKAECRFFLRFSFQERLWSSSWTCLPALQSVQLSDNPHICIFWHSLVTARTWAVGQWPKAFPWQLCAKATVTQAKNAPDGSSPSFFPFKQLKQYAHCHWSSLSTDLVLLALSFSRKMERLEALVCGSQPVLCSSPRTAPGQRAGWGFWLKITSSDVANESWHSGPMFWAVHF